MAATLLAACQEVPEQQPEAAIPEAEPEYSCGRDGYLKTELFGAISANINWQTAELNCEGMPRPEGRGARLRFAGREDGTGQDVAVIIALPDLQPGETGVELTTNATIILEGSGRFFNTAAADVCWTDVLRAEPLSGERFAISGRLYCISPLVEVNGDASVSIPELQFSGLIDWNRR
jgi:hypothetical protein